MNIRPVPEQEADEALKKDYEEIKKAFGSSSVPVFFTYLGAFPQYLSYLTEQIAKNLQSSDFKKIVDELSVNSLTHIHATVPLSPETITWLGRYKASPDFFHFQKDLKEISVINMKLACIFIALREAVKGWAIAARKLKDGSYERKYAPHEDMQSDEFVYDIDPLTSLIKSTQSIQERPGTAISKSLLSDYMKLCQADFRQGTKTEQFWTTRVQIEKNILNMLHVFPHLIYSPYNVIARLIGTDDRFDEILYLLSEHFPTLSMHRLMFSTFMIQS
jgi:hypothetical protein